jgi:hypothetical protein
VAVDLAERSAQRLWGGWVVGRGQRPQQPVVELVVEDRDALPVRGQDVGVGPDFRRS